VHTGNGDGDHFDIDFPQELNNTDYLRRVLASVTYALRPSYETAITTGGLAPVTVSGHPVQAANADCYAVLKHIKDNMAYYENALGVTKEILRDTSKWLKDARNHLAHESLHGVSRDELMKSFEHADKIALLTHEIFVQRNLHSLRARVEAHWASKDRRLGISFKATAEAAAPTGSASAAEKGVVLQHDTRKGHWQFGTYDGAGSVKWFSGTQYEANATTNLVAFKHGSDVIICQENGVTGHWYFGKYNGAGGVDWFGANKWRQDHTTQLLAF
jgi:hypothetical protein